MKLRVNLYQAALQPRLEKLPLAQWLRLLGIVLLLLAVGAGLLQWQLNTQRQLAQQSDALVAQKMQELETYQQALTSRQPEPVLQQQLLHIQHSVQQKQQLLQFLQRETTAALPDYAAVLQHLSQIDPEGLWLTSFRLGQQQHQFQGVVQQGPLLPVWLQKLGLHPALQGRDFADIKMQPLENSTYLQFSVQSAPALIPAVTLPEPVLNAPVVASEGAVQ